MTTAKEVIKHLLTSYKETDHLAVAIWSADDVLARAKERNIEISQEKAEEIIDSIEERQDATNGITWDTIDCFLDDLDK